MTKNSNVTRDDYFRFFRNIIWILDAFFRRKLVFFRCDKNFIDLKNFSSKNNPKFRT